MRMTTPQAMAQADALCAALGAGGSGDGALVPGARLDRAPLATSLEVLGRAPVAGADAVGALAALHDLVADLRVEPVRVFAEDERLALAVRLTGTVDGDPVSVGGVVVAWLDGGKATRVWALADELRFLLQLRAVRLPADVPGAAGEDPSAPPWLDEPTSTRAPAELREVARLLVEDVVSTGDAALAGKVLTGDLVFSRPGLGTAFAALARSAPEAPRGGADFAGLEGFRRGLGAIRRAFPDWEQVVGAGQTAQHDVVVSPIRVRGTHAGPLFGHPATGRAVVFDEVLMMRMRDDRIADIWAMGDEAAFLLGLGMLAT
jgi:predicted ester cyclase